MVSVVHHRVRADLLETSPALGQTMRLYSPLNCATTGKCDYFFLSIALTSLLAFGSLVHSKNDCRVVPNGKVFVWSFCPSCDRNFVVLAPLEGVTAPRSVQPNRYV